MLVLIRFTVDASSLACEASDMPSLHRKAARARFESAVSATASSAATPDPSQEKLYTNADVSKMVKEAVCNAVSHTKNSMRKFCRKS